MNKRPGRLPLACAVFCQETRQLQALRFAAESVGTGCPKLHVFQPDIDNRLQHPAALPCLSQSTQQLR